MMMRILTLIGLGLAVSVMAPAGAAVAETPVSQLSAPQGEPAPRYVPLREVLPQLSEQTGIEFQVPESLQDELIPWPNPEDAGDTPLMDWVRNFSHIDLVDEETGQRKIILLSSNSGSVPASSITHARGKRPVPNRTKFKLSKEKALKLVGVLRSSLMELWEDEEYRAFFSTIGVHTPKELKKYKTARIIRLAARKLFLQMEAYPSSSSPLSKEQAVKLGGIPSYLMIRKWEEDEEYRAFYSALGVQSIEDLKREKTVGMIRREAYRLLLKMQ